MAGLLPNYTACVGFRVKLTLAAYDGPCVEKAWPSDVGSVAEG